MENCIKLHLRGSRVLENQTPPHHSRVHPTLLWKGPFRQLSLLCSTTLYTSVPPPYSVCSTVLHTQVGTRTYTHMHSTTLQRLRPGVSKSTSSPSWPRDGNSAWGRPCPKPQTSGIQLMYMHLESLRFTRGGKLRPRDGSDLPKVTQRVGGRSTRG